MAVRSSVFSTRGLSDSDEREIWREVSSGLYDPRNPADGRLDALVESWHLGSFLLTDSQVRPTLVQRSDALAARSDLDHYVLVHSATQEHSRRIGDEDRQIGLGDVSVSSMGRAQAMLSRGQGCLMMTIPREVLDPMLPRLARGNLHGLHLRTGQALCDLLGLHLRQLRGRVADLEMAEVPFVASSLLQLVAGAAAGQAWDETDAAQRFPAETLERITLFIGENLDRPDLGPDLLMRTFRLSRTTLYQLFKPLGGISAHVTERRLRRCLIDLTDPRMRRRRISEIAFSWGFNSDAHFSRAFRRAFGMAPGDARAAALAQPLAAGDAQAKAALPGRAGARELNDWVRRLITTGHPD
jgi:AraC-like DNA-binding protein